MLSGKIEPFFEKHGAIKLVVDEYRRRLYNNSVKSLCRNIEFNIFYGHYDSQCKGIRLQKYNVKTNTWTKFRMILSNFGAIHCYLNGNLFLFEKTYPKDKNVDRTNEVSFEIIQNLTYYVKLIDYKILQLTK